MAKAKSNPQILLLLSPRYFSLLQHLFREMMGLDRYDPLYLDSVNASRQLEGLGETALQLVLQGSMVLLVWQQTPSGECLKEIFPRDPATFAGECLTQFGIKRTQQTQVKLIAAT